MPEKAQIIPITVFASCETYNCPKKIAWGIGRPDAREFMNYYCDGCMKDIVASIPPELLPEDWDPIDLDGLIGIITEMYATLDDEGKAVLLDAITDLVDADQATDRSDPEDAIKQIAGAHDTATGEQLPASEPKKYKCEHCPAEFDTPIQKATHVRSCPAKKEAEASGKKD